MTNEAFDESADQENAAGTEEDIPVAVEFRWRPDDLTRRPYHLNGRQFQQGSR